MRTALIAGNTLLEAARQKLFNFLLLLALALVASAQGFRDFNFGAPELKFLADFGFGAMAFFGSALTVAATAQLFFAEIESRTVLTLLAKPVSRAEFVVGKFLGVAVVAAVFCALLTALLAGVLWSRETSLMREVPDAFAGGRVLHLGDLVAAGFIQWLKLAVLAALTLLVASFAQSQLYTVISGFFVLVICHLQYLAQETYARSDSILAHLVGGTIGVLFPNFQLFNLAENVGAGAVVPWDGIARLTLYTLAYAGAGCALAVFSFRQREI
jgi:ABC-type transport system involved in multi-copper enzyme maturation permease subunit